MREQDAAAQAAYWNRIDVWPDPVGERWDPPRDWHSREPDALNPAHWNDDNVTGIAVLKNGDAWVSSHTNGLRRLNHDGKFIGDAAAWLPGRSIGAIATDPLDDSVWIGFRERVFASFGCAPKGRCSSMARRRSATATSTAQSGISRWRPAPDAGWWSPSGAAWWEFIKGIDRSALAGCRP